MEAVVIGAGHAGLAASQRLRQLGVDHLVLERDRVGASWRQQRWASFTLNTPSWMNRLPGDIDAEIGEPRDGFITHHALVDRLESYVRRWDLPVQEGVSVTKVEQAPDLTGFRIHVEGTFGDSIECRSVVVASGIQNVPRIPPIANSMPRLVSQLPALGYRVADDLAPGAVLVVGGGQTGGQVVEDLLAAGRSVYWSVSRVTRVPRRYRGRDILEWLVDAGFYEAPVESVTDPAARRAPMPIISGVGRHGHTLSLQWLARRGARLLGRITDIDGTVLHLDDSVPECIRFGDRRSAEVCAQIDEGILAVGHPLPPLEPDEADEPAPDPDALETPDRLDLAEAGIGTVIWATGVTGDFSYLPQEATTADGVPDHDHGAGGLDGLYFIGLPWQTRRGSGIINGIAPDAETTAERVRARGHA